MNNETNIVYSITPSWQFIEEIRQKIRKNLVSKFPDLVEAIIICSSELCENAIKYGVSVPKKEKINFNLMVKDDHILVEVSNGVTNAEDVTNVTQTVDLINSGKNPEDLYLSRLHELMENPKPGESKLGLYRIAFETGFQLSVRFKNEVLTLIAKMKI